MPLISRLIHESFLVFKAQKVLKVRSTGIGLIYRISQFTAFVYVIVYIMYIEFGYQAIDSPVSGVSAKIKGISFSRPAGSIPTSKDKVWDSTDYIVPPQMNSAFFIVTRAIETIKQSYGFCPEEDDVTDAQCQTNANCTAGEIIMTGNGVKSGLCVNSTRRSNIRVCQIYGWCPTEYDKKMYFDPAITRQAENYTVMIKNSIEFPRFKVKRKNILNWVDKGFLKHCRYDKEHEKHKHCPIFRLGYIVSNAEGSNPHIWTRGGMIGININWDCNLDFDVEYCIPEYSFRHLDDLTSKVGQGLNIRYAHYHSVGNEEYRSITKGFGIKVFITVTGIGRKFDVYTLSMNMGSSIGLLSVASFIAEMATMYLLKRFGIYKHPYVDLKKREIVSVKDWRSQKQKKLSKKRTPDFDAPGCDVKSDNNWEDRKD